MSALLTIPAPPALVRSVAQMAHDAELSPEIALLKEAEAALARMGKTFDPNAMADLQGLAADYPELGTEGVGEVVASLFVLLESLMAAGRSDREALRVHLSAWRLILTADPGPEGRAPLLAGLKRVRDLYAADEAA